MTATTVRAASTAIQKQYTTGSVISKDGTTIGYYQLGSGPGVVLIHGGMESGLSHLELAEALASNYTVYLPDRRGRGSSGGFGKDYSMQKEIDDIDALLTKTGAHNIFGISSGALICIHAARTLTAIHKAVIHEPPFPVDGVWSPLSTKPAYDKLIAEGKMASALVLGMKVTQMGPALMRAMPNWLLAWFTTRMMASEDKTAKSGDVTWRALAPTLSYDIQLILEADILASFKSLKAEVLLLYGTASPAFLKPSVDALEKILPHVRRVNLIGLNHGASGPSKMGGKPDVVAQELLQFFA